MRIHAVMLAATIKLVATPLAPQPFADGVETEQMVMVHHRDKAASGQFIRGLALMHNFEYSRAVKARSPRETAWLDAVATLYGASASASAISPIAKRCVFFTRPRPTRRGETTIHADRVRVWASALSQ